MAHGPNLEPNNLSGVKLGPTPTRFSRGPHSIFSPNWGRSTEPSLPRSSPPPVKKKKSCHLYYRIEANRSCFSQDLHGIYVDSISPLPISLQPGRISLYCYVALFFLFFCFWCVLCLWIWNWISVVMAWCCSLDIGSSVIAILGLRKIGGGDWFLTLWLWGENIYFFPFLFWR